MHLRIGGRVWRFLRVPLPVMRKKYGMRGALGFCDAPDKKNKKIVVAEGLPPQKEQEIVMHELLHAAAWHRSEEWVEQIAKDITRAQRRLGHLRYDG